MKTGTAGASSELTTCQAGCSCTGCSFHASGDVERNFSSVIVSGTLAAFHECAFSSAPVGALYVTSGGAARLEGSRFIGNAADVGANGGDGSVIYIDTPESALTIGTDIDGILYYGEILPLEDAPASFLRAQDPGFVALQQVCAAAYSLACYAAASQSTHLD